ncbi:STAS domain-containing protein [Streptomyces arenae]|uniref:STAS domain-containing protein n=1 Tax=Streptomyces arenae TaxID=29301 RepID=UPI002658AD1C|nr:STAS domain-containing protein [Streptomyces arenae]MCG7202294.1 STAS domain-containing protein [Streptomyces arenae]
MSSIDGGSEQPAPQPRISQREKDGAWVISAHGDFDIASSPVLAEALRQAALRYSLVVVDAAGMTFADSTILNVLLKFNMTTTELRVAGPARPFLRVLELTGADTILDIRPSVDDAVKS